jgi:hypothetical protein
MNTPLRLNISQRADALCLALKQFHRFGLAINIDPATSETDEMVRFLQYRRLACAMLGIADNSVNLSLADVTDLAKTIATYAENRKHSY